jgi:hypothetical protein
VRLRRLRESLPTRPELRVFGGYCLAALLYIAIGVTVTDFLLSFWVAVAYVVVIAWLIPTAVRRMP